MRKEWTFFLVGCLALAGVSFMPKANAGDWDQKTVLTFNEPVELPGLVLPAGTYIFRLHDSATDRNLVQVFSMDERTLFDTIRSIPDYRANATNDTAIVFEEQSEGAPRKIKEWFFPDRRYGHEFVYSQPEAMARVEERESSSDQAETQSGEAQSMKDESGGTRDIEKIEENAYLQAQQGQANESDEATKDSEQSAQPNGESPGQMQTNESDQATIGEMPKTASYLPAVGLSGLLLLLGSAAVRLSSKT